MKKLALNQMESLQGGSIICNWTVYDLTGMCVGGSLMCEHRPFVMCIM